MQQLSQSKYTPATGASSRFYYVDSAGDLLSRTSSAGKPVKVAQIGTGYTQIAVSPDRQYVAALKQRIAVHRPARRPARAAGRATGTRR